MCNFSKRILVIECERKDYCKILEIWPDDFTEHSMQIRICTGSNDYWTVDLSGIDSSNKDLKKIGCENIIFARTEDSELIEYLKNNRNGFFEGSIETFIKRKLATS